MEGYSTHLRGNLPQGDTATRFQLIRLLPLQGLGAPVSAGTSGNCGGKRGILKSHYYFWMYAWIITHRLLFLVYSHIHTYICLDFFILFYFLYYPLPLFILHIYIFFHFLAFTNLNYFFLYSHGGTFVFNLIFLIHCRPPFLSTSHHIIIWCGVLSLLYLFIFHVFSFFTLLYTIDFISTWSTLHFYGELFRLNSTVGSHIIYHLWTAPLPL